MKKNCHGIKKLILMPVSIVVSFVVLSCGAFEAFGSTLELVKKRDQLKCGVSTGVPGFSNPDAEGNWAGLEVDICKALAAAVLGDAEKVEYFPLVKDQGFAALQAGTVDVLITNGGWTLSRDTALGLRFVGASYFGVQGFMVKQQLAGQVVDEMKEPTICMQDEPVLRKNIARYFYEKSGGGEPTYKTIVFRTPGQAAKAFDSDRCQLFFGLQSYLQGMRTYLTDKDGVTILPEVVAREVHGPVIRQGDTIWFSIVRWTLFTLLKAEEYNISSGNVDEFVLDSRQDIEQLLGGRGGSGMGLGLETDWMYQIIKQVGNYQEIFERNIGTKSSLKLDRGQNKLWLDGGLHYSPAFQ